MNSTENLNSEDLKQLEERKFKIKAGLFLTSVASISAIFGFGRTMSIARKSDTVNFNKGLNGPKEIAETGAWLALRALAWGSVYAFIGTGSLAYGIWKLSGATNMKEFRENIGNALPRITKNDPLRAGQNFPD